MNRKELHNIKKATDKAIEIRDFLTAERLKQPETVSPLMDKIIPLLWDVIELIQPKN